MKHFKKWTAVFWFILFFAISLVTYFFEKNAATIIFLISCVILPLYFCHFISGYILGRLGMRDKYEGNLLLNFGFIKYIYRQYSSGAGDRELVGGFFILYFLSIFSLVMAFVLNRLFGN